MDKEEMKLIFQRLKELDDAIEGGECHDVNGNCCENCPFSSYYEEVNGNCCVLGEIVNEISRIKIPEEAI